MAHRHLLSRVLIGGAPTLLNEPADCLTGRVGPTDNRGNHKGFAPTKAPLLNWSSVVRQRDTYTISF